MIASSEIGSPSCFSAMARFNHNFLHVKNLFCNDPELPTHLTNIFKQKTKHLQRARTDVPFPCWHIDCKAMSFSSLIFRKFATYLERGVWYASKASISLWMIRYKAVQVSIGYRFCFDKLLNFLTEIGSVRVYLISDVSCRPERSVMTSSRNYRSRLQKWRQSHFEKI